MTPYSKAMFIFAALALCPLLSGCGGGGGDDSPDVLTGPSVVFDPAVFNGSYAISSRLTANDCTGAAPVATLDESYTVRSDVGFRGIPVSVVTASNGLMYTGFSTEGNSDGVTFFTVNEDFSPHELPNFVPGFNCSEWITIRFDTFTVGADRFSHATRTSGISCTKPNDNTFDFSCTVVYDGSGPVS